MEAVWSDRSFSAMTVECRWLRPISPGIRTPATPIHLGSAYRIAGEPATAIALLHGLAEAVAFVRLLAVSRRYLTDPVERVCRLEARVFLMENRSSRRKFQGHHPRR